MPGTAVNDTSSVTAAAAAWDGMHPGANTLDAAAIVKMTRTLAIIPITLVLALLRTHREGKQGGAQVDIKKIFPWFVLLFLLASIITTVLPIPAAAVSFLKNASKFFIVMAMAAIGLNTDIVKLVKTGGKPIFMGFCCWVAIARRQPAGPAPAGDLVKHPASSFVAAGTPAIAPGAWQKSGIPWASRAATWG